MLYLLNGNIPIMSPFVSGAHVKGELQGRHRRLKVVWTVKTKLCDYPSTKPLILRKYTREGTGVNWDDLRFFLALARTGKLIGAGAMLDVDHTTVRRRIMTLEETLGETLFARSPKGYALTDAGERLVSHAEDVESRMLIAQSDFERGGAI